MGTVEDKLNYLLDTKKKIKDAINVWGERVDETTPFRDYVNQILELPYVREYNFAYNKIDARLKIYGPSIAPLLYFIPPSDIPPDEIFYMHVLFHVVDEARNKSYIYEFQADQSQIGMQTITWREIDTSINAFPDFEDMQYSTFNSIAIQLNGLTFEEGNGDEIFLVDKPSVIIYSTFL